MEQEITLGPLFPRHVAVLVGALIVLLAWVSPLTVPAEHDSRIEAFCFGLLVLTVLFIPREGLVTVDGARRLLTSRESFVGACLHPWRQRDLKQISLPEGCTVLVRVVARQERLHDWWSKAHGGGWQFSRSFRG